MEAACRATRSHLGLLERQIARRAESLTITDRAKARCHGRGRTTWSRRDERLYHEHVDRLSFERRGEIDGLTDLPLSFHPAAIRAPWHFAPRGAGKATCDRLSWSGLHSRSCVAASLAA